MTRDEAIARIQQGIGFRTDLDDQIAYALREAQRMLENGLSLPYFLVEEDQTLTAPAGTDAIALPDGFIREADGEGLRYFDTEADDWVFLEKKLHEEAIKATSGLDPGSPLVYVLRKDSVQVYPERDASYDLTWSYYKRGAELTTDIENSWLDEAGGNPEALIGRAGMLVAEDVVADVPLYYQKFERMFVQAWKGAFAAGILREEAEDPIIVGGRL
jgi:hypothetical protein